MLSRIPSWAVAVTGATIVIVATAISSTLLYESQKNIIDAHANVAKEKQTVDRLWSNHQQADQRENAANAFFAQTLETETSRPLLLQLAAESFRGAVLSMLAASGKPVSEKTPAEIETLEEALRKGDTDAYKMFRTEINDLRLLSQTHLSTISNGIQSAETHLKALQAHESWLYLTYVFFNLLGLMIVMCKDLPVWRGKAEDQ